MGRNMRISNISLDRRFTKKEAFLRTIMHEFGHLFGLLHADSKVFKANNKVYNNTTYKETVKDKNNIMYKSSQSSGTNVLKSQVNAIIKTLSPTQKPK